MFDYPDADGHRDVFAPLAEELARQIDHVAALEAGTVTLDGLPALDTSALDWAAHVMQDRTGESRSG
jgi:hypothetical protein